ncbi:SPX domain-containing protein 5 [Chlorella vulgaris]
MSCLGIRSFHVAACISAILCIGSLQVAAMSIPQAIEGAKAELSKVQGLAKVQRLAVYARIFAAEILGTVAAAPFGLRAFSLHRSLPDGRRQRPSSTVSILRDLWQSAAQCDGYLPPATNSGAGGAQAGAGAGAQGSTAIGSSEEHCKEGAPVVLFCHGGVWAAGSKWHYAPLATRLAQAGVITAVMQYTLYPQALIPQMAAEVSAALSWTMDNAARLGGSPRHVSLVGHSAGAHLCTLTLLHRALAASKAQGEPLQRGPQPAGPDSLQPQPPPLGAANAAASAGQPAAIMAAPSPAAAAAAAAAAGGGDGYGDHRMPLQLVAMAGVYDISKHYLYEEGRQVHKLSTMERACGGSHLFPQNSPAVILGNALRRRHQLQPQHNSWPALQANSAQAAQEAKPPAAKIDESCSAAGAASGERRQGPGVASPGFCQSFELAGEAIARRIGFNRPAGAAGADTPKNSSAGGLGSAQPAGASQELQPAAAAAAVAECSSKADAGDGIMGFTVQAARRLPPTVLTSSSSDVTVPWYESAEQYWMLRDCGTPVKHLMYDQVSHGDFVTGWKALPRMAAEPVTDESDLPPHAADLVKVLSGRPSINPLRLTQREWSSREKCEGDPSAIGGKGGALLKPAGSPTNRRGAMKFARSLQESEQPELHALYKQLKKSLRILDDPSDAGSAVLPQQLPSSSDEDLDDAPEAAAADIVAAVAHFPPLQPQEGDGLRQSSSAAQQGPAGESSQQQQQQPQQQQQQRRDEEEDEGQDLRRPDPEQEARFVALVEQCVQQLNEDYLSKEEMLVIKADLAQSGGAAAGTHGELLASYGAAVNLHGELVLLCHWSMMAYTGIVKILKKHHKRTGQRVQSALLANLLAQPFCSLEEVRGMVRATEQQIAVLGGRLGLAPSAAPSAGTAAAAAVRDPSSQQRQPLDALMAVPAGVVAGGAAGAGSAALPPAAAMVEGTSPGLPQPQPLTPHQQQVPGSQTAEQQPPPTAQAGGEDEEAQALGGAGSGRAVLKRDRSKHYTNMNKRHESLAGPEAPRDPLPQSSGSSMQASQGCGNASQQRLQPTSSDTPTGGSPMGGSPGGGSPTAASGHSSGGSGAPPRRASIMQRTRAALHLWKSLRSNASTPSTVLGQASQAPPQL